MIITCIFVGLVIFSLIGYKIAVKYGSDLDGVFLLASVLSILICVGIGISFIITYSTLPDITAAYNANYEAIIYKLDHLEQYDIYEIKNDVDEWNYRLVKNITGQKNLWVNWWYPEDMSPYTYLEVDTSRSCPCCGRLLSQPTKLVVADGQ